MGLVCVWLIEMILLPLTHTHHAHPVKGVVVLCDKHTAIPRAQRLPSQNRVTLKRHTDVYQIA